MTSAFYVKDNAASNYRVIFGAFDPIAEITRRGVWAFRQDISVSNITAIETELADATINQGDALIVTTGGSWFGGIVPDNGVIVAKTNSPDLATSSDDWLIFSESRGVITSDQAAFLGTVTRTGTRFDFSDDVFVNDSNVVDAVAMATGTPLELDYFANTAPGQATARNCKLYESSYTVCSP